MLTWEKMASEGAVSLHYSCVTNHQHGQASWPFPSVASLSLFLISWVCLFFFWGGVVCVFFVEGGA